MGTTADSYRIAEAPAKVLSLSCSSFHYENCYFLFLLGTKSFLSSFSQR